VVSKYRARMRLFRPDSGRLAQMELHALFTSFCCCRQAMVEHWTLVWRLRVGGGADGGAEGRKHFLVATVAHFVDAWSLNRRAKEDLERGTAC
jgi:hypothetical protein